MDTHYAPQDAALRTDRSPETIRLSLEDNLHRRGLAHLSVRLADSEQENLMRADIVDRDGHVVLQLYVDRETGVMRDFA